MFCFLIVVVLLLLSIPSKSAVRDCSGVDEFDEMISCRFDQMGERVQHLFNTDEYKKSKEKWSTFNRKNDDTWTKLNRNLDNWADKQEKVAKKIFRNMDHNLNKLQNRGPITALLADLTRIIGVVVTLPFTIANVLLREVFGLNKFWSYLLTIF